jgi:hypothetical protein
LTKNLCCGLVLSRNLDKNPFIVKKPSVSQGLPVRKKTLITAIIISALLFSAVAGACFVKSTQANPIISVYRDVQPPAGTQAPIITIHTPRNGSSYPKNITLTFDVTIPKTNGDKSLDTVTKIYYKGNWETNEIIVAEGCFGFFSTDLSDVRGGNLSITIYAVGVGYIETGEDFREENDVIWSYNYYDRFEMTGYSTVSFIKDLVPPRITVLSPPNRTYVTSDVELDFTVSEAASEILYCLDGKENQTTTDSLTLTGLKEGAHNVTLYAADLAGNAAAPKTLFFSADLPESFPIMPVTASIATVAIVSFGLGLLAYFKKRKR